MTKHRIRCRIAQFMMEYFPTELHKSLPSWDGKLKSLLGYIDPIRDLPYIILAIRSGGYKGYDDLMSVGRRI